MKVDAIQLEASKESFTYPKLETSLDASVKDTGLHREGAKLMLPVVPTTESADVKNDNMLPNEKRDKQPPQEFITNKTTLNFVRDSELNTTVLKIKDEKGEVIRQIPDEVRLKIAKFIKETYQEPRIPIINTAA